MQTGAESLAGRRGIPTRVQRSLPGAEAIPDWGSVLCRAQKQSQTGAASHVGRRDNPRLAQGPMLGVEAIPDCIGKHHDDDDVLC